MAGICVRRNMIKTQTKVGTLPTQLATTPLRPSGCKLLHNVAFRHSAASKVYAAKANQEGGEESFNKAPAGGSRPVKHVARPSVAPQGPATKRQLAARDISRKTAVVQDAKTASAPPAPTPLQQAKIQLIIVTGREKDSSLYRDAKVSFVSKEGKLLPADMKQGYTIKGPFKNDEETRPFSFDIPADFDVAGVILDNPKEERTVRQIIGWIADRLNIKIPLIQKNLLDFIIGVTGAKWLTNGDWYVSRVELTRVSGGKGAAKVSTFDIGNRQPGPADQVFPLYGWIQNATQRIAFDGTAYLPQNTPAGLGPWRRGNLLVNQNAYNFQPYNDLSSPPNNRDFRDPNFRPTLDPYPQHLQSDRDGPNAFQLPRDEQFGLSKAEDFNTGTLQGVVNLLWSFLNDGRIRWIILRSVLGGAAAGLVFRYLADKGVSQGFLAWVDAFLQGLIPQGLLRDLFGGLPAAALLAVLAGQLVPGNVLSGAALGALIGVVAGRDGPQAAGLVAGLLGAVVVFVALFNASPLRYETVEAYADACFGHTFKLGPFTIGYEEPFVWKLREKGPEKEWKNDFMFGWQTVAGINPESITRVGSEEDLLAINTLTADDLAKVRSELPSFDDELAKGKIYILDFSLLEGFMAPFNADYDDSGNKATKYLYAPVAILRQDDNAHHKVPVPIAVKLASGEEEIITPGSDESDGKWGWTLAKAIASSANSGVHQLVQHWLRTHAVCETYGIAVRRQLSEMHPLFKLLIFHTRYTMDINNKARQLLINAGTVIESTFSPGPYAMRVSAAAYKGWRFDHENPVTDLKQRGVYDEGSLPNYPYRAHALEVWDAIESYVTDYVALYYKSEDDIADDYELQAFWNDIKRAHSSLDTYLKMEDPEHRAGLEWPDLKTTDDLVHILSTIIWTGSAMHSTVNFGQYDYSAFVPNAPASIGRKFDYEKLHKGKYTERDFMAAMPVATEMTKVMTVVLALVKHSQEEQYLGVKQGVYPGWKFADPWFTESKADAVYSRFVERIEAAQRKLEGFNEEAKTDKSIPYFYLLPKAAGPQLSLNVPAQGVPNSVTI